MVSKCSLTDDLDLVLNEGIECIIDEDCEFFAPSDAPFWRCISTRRSFFSPKTCANNTCRVCKRCPAGLDIPTSTLTTTEYPAITDAPTTPWPRVNQSLSNSTNTSLTNSTTTPSPNSGNNTTTERSHTVASSNSTPAFEMFTPSPTDFFDNSSDVIPVTVSEEDDSIDISASVPPAPINIADDPLINIY